MLRSSLVRDFRTTSCCCFHALTLTLERSVMPRTNTRTRCCHEKQLATSSSGVRALTQTQRIFLRGNVAQSRGAPWRKPRLKRTHLPLRETPRTGNAMTSSGSGAWSVLMNPAPKTAEMFRHSLPCNWHTLFLLTSKTIVGAMPSASYGKILEPDQ